MNKTIITVRFKSNSSKGKFAGIIEEREDDYNVLRKASTERFL